MSASLILMYHYVPLFVLVIRSFGDGDGGGRFDTFWLVVMYICLCGGVAVLCVICVS